MNPKITVDIIIRYQDGIVLVKRKNPPLGWAIPGGFVDYGESLEQAAVREAKEETNLDIDLEKQFHAYSDPNRDKRWHIITMVFIANGKGVLKAGDDALEAKVFTLQDIPNLVNDHNQVLEDFFKNRFTS